MNNTGVPVPSYFGFCYYFRSGRGTGPEKNLRTHDRKGRFVFLIPPQVMTGQFYWRNLKNPLFLILDHSLRSRYPRNFFSS